MKQPNYSWIETARALLITVVVFMLPLSLVARTKGEVTPDQVRAFVENAQSFAKNQPKAVALSAFSAKTGEFNQDGLYIFAYDFSGTVLAHGGDQGLIGFNLMGMKDANGVEVIKELARLARKGGGWLHYTWPNPEHQGRQEPKFGYVVRINDDWFIGSGTYGKGERQE